jgi:hypothetical protein
MIGIPGGNLGNYGLGGFGGLGMNGLGMNGLGMNGSGLGMNGLGMGGGLGMNGLGMNGLGLNGGGGLYNPLAMNSGNPFLTGGAPGQFAAFNQTGISSGGDLPGLGPLGSGLFNLGGPGLNKLASNSADMQFWLSAAGGGSLPIIYQPYYVGTIPGLSLFMTG